ncbi:hypothetical protein [Paractinoplanes hotanensis]|uniref:Uncharacterized protein n=1 Tax=Paractinoplanes hotanensis TaxID=2906497 RepID=A0ABT0Y5J6_9ACTN|nr:hypothetical protein [Actinoplanes hotanensis]MCM4081095.1 hypothetical protein [Actinoplanes hotanensis]
MSVDTADTRWAGTPLDTEHWLEGRTGFPPGSVLATSSPESAEVVATARGLTLSRRQLDEVVAFAEFLAGRKLGEDDRAELADDIIDAFDDTPKAALRFLRPLSAAVRRVGSLDPIRRAQRRLQALTTTWVVELRREADSGELSPVMTVVSRHNPVVRHWAAGGIVLVADALDARWEQHRLVLGLAGRAPEPVERLAERLVARTEDASRLEVAELAAAEVRLLVIRSWLRDLGRNALAELSAEIDRGAASALDVDIVVQQVGHRAALGRTGRLS